MHIYDWPALGIGLIVGFYWGRVIKLVFKTKKKTGKAANFLPPELLGAILRVIWYPTVAAWIVIPMVYGIHHQPNRLFQPFYNIPVISWLAWVVALFAMYLTMVCWRKMGKDWRMGIDPEEKNTLIITGPYSYVRHPIYALSSLLMIVSFIAVPIPLMVFIAVVHLTFLQWEARREEGHMVQIHGEKYSNYMKQVGRFIPRGKYIG